MVSHGAAYQGGFQHTVVERTHCVISGLFCFVVLHAFIERGNAGMEGCVPDGAVSIDLVPFLCPALC